MINYKKAFTLIELLVVVSIICLVLGIIAGYFQSPNSQSPNSQSQTSSAPAATIREFDAIVIDKTDSSQHGKMITLKTTKDEHVICSANIYYETLSVGNSYHFTLSDYTITSVK